MRLKPVFAFLIFALGALGLTPACGDPVTEDDGAKGDCAAGETRACTGPRACEGGQICSGSGWSTCDCGGNGQGGADGDGSDGTPSGSGGSGAGTGSGGVSSECETIEATTKFGVENSGNLTRYVANHTLSGEGAALEGQRLFVEAWGSPPALGTFTLGTGENVNILTCKQCMVLGDYEAATFYFATEGSFTLDAFDGGSPYVNGGQGSFSGVILREVTFDADANETVLVEDGDCYELTDDTFDSANGSAPAGWTCNNVRYSDLDCTCGCGVLDPVCGSITGKCENNGCGEGLALSQTDNTQCVGPPLAWTCPDQPWGNGLCDCGCGALDPECDDATLASCDEAYCGEVEGIIGGLADENDTTQCSGWTCRAVDRTDDDYDCGCGLLDPGCENALATSCDWEWCGPGFTSGSAGVSANDNSQCDP